MLEAATLPEYRPDFPLVSQREAVQCWFLIQSGPCRERNVKAKLESFSIPVFLPLITTRRSGGRGEHCPLFPSYLFAQFERNKLPEINEILELNGLTARGRVVCFGGEPAEIQAVIINEIRERQVNGLIDLSAEFERENAKRVQSLEFGDRVVVLSGAFVGQQGIFQNCKDGRVKALFGLLNVSLAAREIARV